MSTPENTSSHDRASEFFKGDADEQAVQDYLNLAQASNIVQLAALMAPRSKRFDADALVDQAIELNSAADRGLRRKREAMVASLNYRTLLQLLTHLAVPFGLIYSEGDDEKFRDPLSGPPLSFLRSILKRSFELDRARQAKALKEGVRKLSKSHGATPRLPCDLITILRYASPSKTIPDEVLTAAFTDFLGLYQNPMEREAEEETRNEHAELESLRERQGELSPSQQALLDQCASGLKAIDERQRYRETFTPNGQKHPEMDAEGKAIFEKHWSGNRADFDERNLLWIAEEFTPFLKTHGTQYEGLYRERRRQQQVIKKARSQAGQKGAKSREETRWKRHTDELCTYLRSNKRQAFADPHDLLEAFLGTQNQLRTSKSKREFMNFFGAIWISAKREPEDLTVPGKILPALSVDTLGGIRREVGAALKALEKR